MDIKEANETLRTAMRDDPEYAWAWHCNIAMPIMDSTGVSHAEANKAGAQLMRHLFGYDITKHPYYVDITARSTGDQPHE